MRNCKQQFVLLLPTLLSPVKIENTCLMKLKTQYQNEMKAENTTGWKLKHRKTRCQNENGVSPRWKHESQKKVEICLKKHKSSENSKKSAEKIKHLISEGEMTKSLSNGREKDFFLPFLPLMREISGKLNKIRLFYLQ